MADYTPSGAAGLMMAALKSLVSNTDQWKAMVGGSPSAATAAKHILYAYNTYRIRAAAIATNVATLTLVKKHGMAVGDVINVRGIASPYSGQYTLTAVTANTISYARTASDDSMTVRSDQAIVVPVALPFMIIRPAPSSGRAKIALDTCVANGSLVCQVEAAVSSAYLDDPDNQEIEGQDVFSLLVEDVADLAGTGGYLVLRGGIDAEYLGPVQPAQQDNNQHEFETWLANMTVKWGFE